jgi:hypothetical protein
MIGVMRGYNLFVSTADWTDHAELWRFPAPFFSLHVWCPKLGGWHGDTPLKTFVGLQVA